MAGVDDGEAGLTVVVTSAPTAPTPPVPPVRAAARVAARVAAARVTATARRKRARTNGRGVSDATEPSTRRARSEATTDESHETTTEQPQPQNILELGIGARHEVGNFTWSLEPAILLVLFA